MMTASAGTTHCKKMKLYIIFEFLNFSDLFGTPIGLKPCSGYTCTDNVQFHTKVPKLTQCGSRSPKYIHVPFPTSFPGSHLTVPWSSKGSYSNKNLTLLITKRMCLD